MTFSLTFDRKGDGDFSPAPCPGAGARFRSHLGLISQNGHRETYLPSIFRHSRSVPSRTNPTDSYPWRALSLCSITSSHRRWTPNSSKHRRMRNRRASFPHPRSGRETTIRVGSMEPWGFWMPCRIAYPRGCPALGSSDTQCSASGSSGFPDAAPATRRSPIGGHPLPSSGIQIPFLGFSQNHALRGHRPLHCPSSRLIFSL